MPVQITPQSTPNPNAMKFTLDQALTTGSSRTFASEAEAAADPLAQKIFALGGIRQVFFLNNFITVNRDGTTEWSELTPKIEAAIRAQFD